MNRTELKLAHMALVACLAGCASPTPMLDEKFGDSVRQIRAMQTLNPDAGNREDGVVGMDGLAAREAMGRYQESFRTPPPTVNVINIGGSVTGGGK